MHLILIYINIITISFFWLSENLKTCSILTPRSFFFPKAEVEFFFFFEKTEDIVQFTQHDAFVLKSSLFFCLALVQARDHYITTRQIETLLSVFPLKKKTNRNLTNETGIAVLFTYCRTAVLACGFPNLAVCINPLLPIVSLMTSFTLYQT